MAALITHTVSRKSEATRPEIRERKNRERENGRQIHDRNEPGVPEFQETRRHKILESCSALGSLTTPLGKWILWKRIVGSWKFF